MGNAPEQSRRQRDYVDLFIRVALLALAIAASVRIILPFFGLVLWALVLAVTLYPLFLRLRGRLGDSSGRTATLMTLVFILMIGVPAAFLGASFAGEVVGIVGALRTGTLEIPPPVETLQNWPLLGNRVYEVWSEAYNDTPAFLEHVRPQIAGLTKAALGAAASTAGTLLLFIAALIVAGIMMAYGESGSAALQRIACRAAGNERGEQIHHLSTLTVRSVAAGVVGVALVQALLLGIGFLFAGIPGAGVLAMVVLVIGILQLPALLVSLPAIGYVWAVGDASTAINVVLTVYFLVAGFADNVLKPMLLGRGVDVPMPVVLLGALGGMVTSGIVGLFTGSVILSVVYQLLMEWVQEDEVATADAGSAD